jgi:hypothetical protein
MKTPHLRGQAEHYRELAARFRGLANTEHLGSLRRHLRRLAVQHDELADGLVMLPSDQHPALRSVSSRITRPIAPICSWQTKGSD